MLLRTVPFVLVSAALISPYLCAQDEHTIQAFQFGAGGSFARSTRLPRNNNFGGFVFAGTFTQNPHLRWTFDGGFQFAGVPPEFAPTSQMLAQFHVGPEITRRYKRGTVFAHALPGYTAWSLGSFGEGSSFFATQGGFSMSTGGGVDLHARTDMDIRLQADYMPAWLRQGTPNERVASRLPPLESPYGNLRFALFVMKTGDRADSVQKEPDTEPAQTYQFGGGPSYLRSNRLDDRKDLLGVVAGASWAQNRHLRWTGDVGIEFAGSAFKVAPPGSLALAQDLVQIHAGAEFTRRSVRTTLFAHALPGATVWMLTDNHTYGTTAYKEGGFSIEAGGGIDWHQGRRFDVRLQADYIPVWFHASTPTTALNLPVPPPESACGNFRLAIVLLGTGLRSENR